MRVARPQVDRRETALPVVRVHDVGREAGDDRRLERRARERREPPRVVRMIVAADAVQPFAIEERGNVDQPQHRAAGRARSRKICTCRCSGPMSSTNVASTSPVTSTPR